MYSKVESEPKHEVAIIEREFKFRKRMVFSVLGSLRTVPLHSTLAVNNLGLKLFIATCFCCFINKQIKKNWHPCFKHGFSNTAVFSTRFSLGF